MEGRCRGDAGEMQGRCRGDGHLEPVDLGLSGRRAEEVRVTRHEWLLPAAHVRHLVRVRVRGRVRVRVRATCYSLLASYCLP